MKLISSRTHGVVDYIIVALFLLAPAIFRFSGAATTVCDVLGIALLAVSMCTAYPLGIVKLIPLRAHGWVELTAGVAAAISPFLFRFSEMVLPRDFLIVTGVALIVLWVTTDYAALRKPLSAGHHRY